MCIRDSDVADALAGTGFTAMVGDAVAGVLGSGVSPFVFIVAFALLTSTCATFTGSNMGSVYIFAPIAIAACTSLGLNPVSYTHLHHHQRDKAHRALCEAELAG